jgi:uncharacterized protein YabE (DUF348 family)
MLGKVKLTITGELELDEDDITQLKTATVEQAMAVLVRSGRNVTVTVKGKAKKRRLERGR